MWGNFVLNSVQTLEDWKDAIRELEASGLSEKQVVQLMPPNGCFPAIVFFEEEQWCDLLAIARHPEVLRRLAEGLRIAAPLWLREKPGDFIRRHAVIQLESLPEAFAAEALQGDVYETLARIAATGLLRDQEFFNEFLEAVSRQPAKPEVLEALDAEIAGHPDLLCPHPDQEAAIAFLRAGCIHLARWRGQLSADDLAAELQDGLSPETNTQ